MMPSGSKLSLPPKRNSISRGSSRSLPEEAEPLWDVGVELSVLEPGVELEEPPLSPQPVIPAMSMPQQRSVSPRLIQLVFIVKSPF